MSKRQSDSSWAGCLVPVGQGLIVSFTIGLIYIHMRARSAGVEWALWALYLAAVAVIVAMVVVTRRRLKRQSRAAAGLCTSCGYDLRASRDRCPECGTVIPASRHEPNV